MSDTDVVVGGANATYGFYPNWVPVADDWNRMFGGKVDAIGGYLTDPTVYGQMTLTNWPLKDTDAACKSYVDAILGDGNSLPDAPADGVSYCRANHAWVPAPVVLTGDVLGDLSVGGNLSVGGTSILAGEVLIGMTVFSGYALDMIGAIRASGSGTFGTTVMTNKGSLLLNINEPPEVTAAGVNGGWAFANGLTANAMLFNLYTDQNNFYNFNGGYGYMIRSQGFQLNFSVAPNAVAGAATTPALAMYIDQNLSLLINGQGYKPGGGAWASVSDARVKQETMGYTSGLAQVSKLRPITYQYNGEGGTIADGKTYHGLVAQEVQPVMPEMVAIRVVNIDGVDTDVLTIDSTPLLYALVNAVSELGNRVAALDGQRPT